MQIVDKHVTHTKLSTILEQHKKHYTVVLHQLIAPARVVVVPPGIVSLVGRPPRSMLSAEVVLERVILGRVVDLRMHGMWLVRM
jgi:hypothetical protein